MDQYFNQTQTLYNSGARRFLFLTTPPIERTPSVQSGGDANVKAEGAAVKQYNDALKARVAKFAAANPQAKTYVVDTTVPFTKALDNPKEYGADNATCYDESGTKCLWWNDVSFNLPILLGVSFVYADFCSITQVRLSISLWLRRFRWRCTNEMRLEGVSMLHRSLFRIAMNTYPSTLPNASE